MVKNNVRSFLLLILLAALPAAGLAQDANTLLSGVAKAMGAENLKTLHYSGSGSSYAVGQSLPSEGAWPHRIMKSYVRDLNLDTAASRVQIVRTEGTPPAEQTHTQTIDPNSPWATQFDYWLTPYGFIKGAMANNATVEAKTVFGTPFRVVTFMIQGKYKVVGYINGKDMIEKVETTIDKPGEMSVEAHYHDYTDFGGFKFPTTIIQKHAGSVSLIVIVKDVKPNAAVKI